MHISSPVMSSLFTGNDPILVLEFHAILVERMEITEMFESEKYAVLTDLVRGKCSTAATFFSTTEQAFPKRLLQLAVGLAIPTPNEYQRRYTREAIQLYDRCAKNPSMTKKRIFKSEKLRIAGFHEFF